MTVLVRTVTDAWGQRELEAFGAGPFHSREWGDLVGRALGGRFSVLRVAAARSVRHVPLLIGGSLGGSGFACGHVGYGGVFDGADPDLALVEQIDTLRYVEEYLDLRCTRLITAPTDRLVEPRSAIRETIVVPLCANPDDQWRRYSSRARRSVRRCRQAGLSVGTLSEEEVGQALQLVHRTQQRVGAEYRMPLEMLRGLASSRAGGLVLACRSGNGTLVAVGVFLHAAQQAAYLGIGWSEEHAAVAPSYLVLHEAITRLRSRGARILDLGYSHRPGLREFKQTWSKETRVYVALDGLVTSSVVSDPAGSAS